MRSHGERRSVGRDHLPCPRRECGRPVGPRPLRARRRSLVWRRKIQTRNKNWKARKKVAASVAARACPGCAPAVIDPPARPQAGQRRMDRNRMEARHPAPACVIRGKTRVSRSARAPKLPPPPAGCGPSPFLPRRPNSLPRSGTAAIRRARHPSSATYRGGDRAVDRRRRPRTRAPARARGRRSGRLPGARRGAAPPSRGPDPGA